MLQPAQVEDAPDIAALAAVIWPEAFAEMISAAQIDYMLEHLQSAAAMANQMRDGMAYFFLIRNGDRIGYAALKHDPEQRVSLLSKLYILAEARGSNVSALALTELYAVARAAGSERISLTVNRFNARAIRFYEKHDFVTTRELVADIGGGFVMDDYCMERPLALKDKSA
ncbi:MAG: N-acetyltransferase family protein [Gammaproteobacteria bacterium]